MKLYAIFEIIGNTSEAIPTTISADLDLIQVIFRRECDDRYSSIRYIDLDPDVAYYTLEDEGVHHWEWFEGLKTEPNYVTNKLLCTEYYDGEIVEQYYDDLSN